MDRHLMIEKNLMMQTIMRLLSLALMAHLAAFGSRRDRRNLLDIVSLAEGAGLRLCAGYGYYEGDTSDASFGYSSSEALRLAASLRMIAFYLSFHVGRIEKYAAARQAWIDGFRIESVIWLVIAVMPADAADVALEDTS